MEMTCRVINFFREIRKLFTARELLNRCSKFVLFMEDLQLCPTRATRDSIPGGVEHLAISQFHLQVRSVCREAN